MTAIDHALARVRELREANRNSPVCETCKTSNETRWLPTDYYCDTCGFHGHSSERSIDIRNAAPALLELLEALLKLAKNKEDLHKHRDAVLLAWDAFVEEGELEGSDG